MGRSIIPSRSAAASKPEPSSRRRCGEPPAPRGSAGLTGDTLRCVATSGRLITGQEWTSRIELNIGEHLLPSIVYRDFDLFISHSGDGYRASLRRSGVGDEQVAFSKADILLPDQAENGSAASTRGR